DDSNYVKKDGDVQDIQGILRKTTLDQPYPEPTDDDYITLGAVKSEFVSSIYSGSINGNLTATSFIKSGKDDTSVLLAGGGDVLLSSFGGEITVGGSLNINVCQIPNTYVPSGFVFYIQHGDAAGLSDFPELYAYIRERYPKPIGEQPQPVPIGDQTLQQQVKNNDDIINNSNEEFEPPVPNAITKLDLSSQLERQSFLASSGSDPQLIVYGDRITLTASYATTGVFPNGYLFKSYPAEARPKMGDQVIALVGTDASKNKL
ncbi:MAG: hypothetical protein EZS28_044214, partial [Streblomastix strix]